MNVATFLLSGGRCEALSLAILVIRVRWEGMEPIPAIAKKICNLYFSLGGGGGTDSSENKSLSSFLILVHGPGSFVLYSSAELYLLHSRVSYLSVTRLGLICQRWAFISFKSITCYSLLMDSRFWYRTVDFFSKIE